MRIRDLLSLPCLLIVISLPCETWAQGLDQIAPLRGTPATGSIVSMSPDEVVIEMRGSERKFAVNEIKRITFAGDAPELRRAREDILTGQLESGLDALKQMDIGRIKRDAVRRDLQFYIAYCQGKLALSGGGDKNAAVTALLNLVREDPQNYHYYEAAELLGDLAVALESYDNAARYYAAIGKAPWPEYKMRSALLEAGSLAAQADFQAALAKYDDVLEFGVDSPEATRHKLLAQVGRAVCLAETGEHAEGISLLEEIIQKNDPQDAELFAHAYNALGRCYLKASQPKEALRAYLHVDILFYASPEAHAEALYHLGRLWGEVNKSDRAASARSLLMDRYSGSVWAKRE